MSSCVNVRAEHVSSSRSAREHHLTSAVCCRKELEKNELLSKIADEQATNKQLHKKMKELHVAAPKSLVLAFIAGVSVVTPTSLFPGSY